MTAALEVTDHAVLRFMERVLGLPVEQIRKQIAATPGLAAAAAMGSEKVSIDGHTYQIKGRRYVTTITPGRTPVSSVRGGYSKHGRNGGTNGAMIGRDRNGGRGDRAFDGGEE